MVNESRSICFTSFDIDEEKMISKIRSLDFSYYVFGFEICPNTQRPHLQGFIQFKKKFSFKKIAKCLECHCEVPLKCPEDNIRYCKKDNKFREEGIPRGLSKASDKSEKWKELIDLAKKNNIEEIEIRFPSAAIIHRKSLALIRDESIKADHHPERKCVWIWGASGIGKTRWAFDNFDTKDVFTMSDSDGWDQYNQEKIALLDEVDDTIQSNWKKLLRWADRYPLKARRLYGITALNYELLILTSMKNPSLFFNGDQWNAIQRRFIIVEAIGYDAIRKDLIIRDSSPFPLYLRTYLFKFYIIF